VDIRLDAEHHSFAQCDAALGFVIAGFGIGGRAIFPDEVAGLAVQREDLLLAGGDIHHAVFHDGRALLRKPRAESGLQASHPCALQCFDVRWIDAGER
jgi:hypothetical protein